MLDKKKRPERIIQFGEGGFLRGFFDWMLQKMNDANVFDGSAVVVQPIEKGLCHALEEQNCVYTHIARGAEGVDRTLIDSISRCVDPYRDYAAYLALAESPELRFIVSNTTEAGIEFSPLDGFDDAPPRTFPAKLTRLLHRRFELGLRGFVFLPCELIDRNGDALKACVLKYARLWKLSADFERWINDDNVFTSTLVDRINTGHPRGEAEAESDPFLNASEFFHLWVIETGFDIERELPFSAAGLNVIVTPNKLETYRTRKVRILNGAHTSLVPYALLEGFDTVRSCVLDARMRAHIEGCIFDEIIPTLDLPESELRAYADDVIRRFENPYIDHFLSSIALNSVSKFKVRVLPSILEYRRRFGTLPKRLTFSLAKLLEFYKTDMVNDGVEVVQRMRRGSVAEILKDETLWGTDISFMAQEVEGYADKRS